MRLSRVFRWGLAGAMTGLSVSYLIRNDFDFSSIGLVRLARAVSTASRIVVDYKWSLQGLDETSDHCKQTWSSVHKRSADRLFKLACSNGGVYIKVGQYLGALDYLLPMEYTKRLSILHSNAPQAPLSDVHRVIREELGLDVSSLFLEFESRPSGAASLAQVHRAVLPDGRVVAVKVQHRYAKSHSFVDMATMEFLARLVALVFPEFKLMWLVEETKKNLPKELDFVHEGHNADRVRRMFPHLHFLKIPEIYWDLTTDRVLTMEFCKGNQVTDLSYLSENKIDPIDVCHKLSRLYSEMIFLHGYVHCDPHPGNVLVCRDERNDVQLALLDHGLYATLQDDLRLNYANLWLSLLRVDMNGLRHWAGLLGVGDLYGLFACMVTARSWQSVTRGIDKHSPTTQENVEIQNYASSLLPQISDILDRVPRPLLLLLKTNDLLRGIECSLGVGHSAASFVQMSKCCVGAVHQMAFRRCPDWRCRLRVSLSAWLSLLRIYIYQQIYWLVARFSIFARMTI